MDKHETPQQIRDRIKGLRRVRPSELRRNPHAWKKHTKRQRKALKDVMTEIGFADALLARELDDGSLELINGELRADILPDQEVSVVVVDVNEEEARTLLATMDPLGAMADTDGAKLKALLESVLIPSSELRDDLEERARRALRKLDPETIVDVDAIDPPATPITRRGDLWILGNHRLLCGDATIVADVERVLAGELARMVLTDPPYGVNYVGKTAAAMTIQNDGAEGLPELLDQSFTIAAKHTVAGGTWYVAAPAGPQMLVWVKDALVLGHGDYHYRHEVVFAGEMPLDDAEGKSHEHILYGWKPGAKHTAPEDRTWSTVLEYARPKANRLHPTMKPADLWGDLMRNGSVAGDVVLDMFGGSGITTIVAEQLGRVARTIELGEGYCDVIVERWQRLTGRQAVRESDGVAFDEVAS
jgi:DNA modification methylase